MKEKGKGQEKRTSFRLNDCLECTYAHIVRKKEVKNKAIVLDLSSHGLMMITREFLKSGKEVKVVINVPPKSLSLCAKVIDSKIQWYVTDQGKDMYFSTRLAFEKTSASQRDQIIKYVYKCKGERRKAKMKKMDF